MTITSDTLRRLAVLNLAPEAMSEVLSIIADLQAKEDDRRARDRERQAVRWRRMGVAQLEWAELRRQVFERDDGCCQYCGDTFAVTVDHVVPLAAGGETTLDNLVTACGTCNSSKRDRPVAEWEAGR